MCYILGRLKILSTGEQSGLRFKDKQSHKDAEVRQIYDYRLHDGDTHLIGAGALVRKNCFTGRCNLVRAGIGSQIWRCSESGGFFGRQSKQYHFSTQEHGLALCDRSGCISKSYLHTHVRF